MIDFEQESSSLEPCDATRRNIDTLELLVEYPIEPDQFALDTNEVNRKEPLPLLLVDKQDERVELVQWNDLSFWLS